MNNKKIIGILCGLGLVFALAQESNADTLYLKNGRKITGKIVEDTRDHVKIDCLNKGMFTTYKKTNVKKIERDEPSASVVPAAAEGVSGAEEPKNDQTNASAAADLRAPEGPEFLLYVPKGLEPGRLYPLAVMFHPDGDAQAMIDLWKQIADEKKWILYGSTRFRSQGERWCKFEWLSLQKIFKQYPVDRKRVVAVGLAEGGTAAHSFSYFCPKIISAVVTNAGMMDAYLRSNERRAKRYPHDKIAVFLVSRADFGYRHMDTDKKFLEGVGWRTARFEYEGGHIVAPGEVFAQGADWLDNNWKQ
ncbi:MAG: hypothetical protein PHO30_04720 [Candidatus Omnitrophica bacterium]|nr:hypothetical protein [Candidatus Omnitrophota bacterium]